MLGRSGHFASDFARPLVSQVCASWRAEHLSSIGSAALLAAVLLMTLTRYPATLPLLAALLCLLFSLRRKDERLALHTDILLLSIASVVIAIELVAFWRCSYPPNSLRPLEWTIEALVLFQAATLLLHRPLHQQWCITIMAAGGMVLAAAAIPSFIVTWRGLRSLGFEDLNSFRHLLAIPRFTVPIAEGATLFLALLPFAFVSAVMGPLRIQRWIGYAAHVGCLSAILLTLSRGLLAGAATFLLLILIVGKYSGSILAKRRAVLINVAALGAALILAVSVTGRSLETTAKLTGTQSQIRSAEGRFTVWRSIWPALGDVPPFGIGAGNFARYHWKARLRAGMGPLVDRAYNAGLHIFVEKGGAGVVAYIVFVAAILMTALRRCSRHGEHDAAVIIAVTTGFVALVVRDLTYSAILQNRSVGAATAILLALATQSPGASQRSRSHPPRRDVLAALLVVSGMALAYAGYVNLPRAHAEELIALGARSLLARRNAEAESNFAAAACLVPSNANYAALEGLAVARSLPFATQPASQGMTTVAVSPETSRRLQEAIAHYKRALALSPLDDGFHVNLGYLLAWSKQPAEALTAFRDAATFGPDVGLNHVALGSALAAAGRPADAHKAYADALRATPGLLDSAWLDEVRTHDPDEYERLLDELSASAATRGAAHDPMAQATLASVYLRRGSMRQASDLLVRVTTQMPQWPRPWRNLGRIRMTESSFAEAEQCFLRASRLDRTDAVNWYLLARLSEMEGRRAQAIQSYTSQIRVSTLELSAHAVNARPLYGSFASPANDLVLATLVSYLKPKGSVAEGCGRLRQLVGDSAWQRIEPTLFGRCAS